MNNKDVSTTASIELAIASQYWGRLLRARSVPEPTVKKFEQTLSQSLLEGKIKNHWHPETPAKGQAHRSISMDRFAKPEPAIVKAANSIGIHNFFDFIPTEIESMWMWVDPGEVSVKLFFMSSGVREETLFKQPRKLQLKANPIAGDVPLHYSDEFWQEKLRRTPSPPPMQQRPASPTSVSFVQQSPPGSPMNYTIGRPASPPQILARPQPYYSVQQQPSQISSSSLQYRQAEASHPAVFNSPLRTANALKATPAPSNNYFVNNVVGQPSSMKPQQQLSVTPTSWNSPQKSFVDSFGSWDTRESIVQA